MLEFLEKKIQGLKIKNIGLILSNEDEIPLENESVDILISINTLHEFDDKGRMIEEIRRVLRRYGKLLIVDFKKEDTGFGPPVAIRVSKEQAKSLFEKKGFTILKSEDLMYHYLLVLYEENLG
jgi:ubiquinone/menaquinone biosynthesis C-methylase UbiE